MDSEPIKKVLLFLIAATAVTASTFAQQPSQGTVVPKIQIRLLNGKNGKPIKDDTPNIWFDDANSSLTKGPLNPHTDANGEISLAINDRNVKYVRVLPNQYADCRFKDDSIAGRLSSYSLTEIITKGIVSNNVCGKQQAEPRPGVLIIYVRPMTFMERWRL